MGFSTRQVGATIWNRLTAMLAAGAFAAAAGTASAQLSIPALNTPVTENFDSMGTAAAATLPNGFQWNRRGSGDSVPNTTGETWNLNDPRTATIARAGTSGTGVFTGSTSGSTFNLANGVADTATDRAIGFMGSGSFPSSLDALANNTTRTFHLFAQVQNNTGSTVDSLSLTWDYEKYRSGSRAWAWTFWGSPDGVNWTAITSGDQAYPADGGNTVVSDPPAATAKSATAGGLGLTNGSFYYFRWTLIGSGGSSNGQAIGVDNVQVTASAVAVPVVNVDTTSFASNFGITRPTIITPATAPYPSFTVSGTNLAVPITATAPTGFEVSTDETTWFNAVNIGPAPSPSGTVYVRFNPATVAAFSGNVAVTSGAAAPSNVGVSGLSADAPISIAAVNTAYSQNFDALPNTGSATFTSSITPIPGWYGVRSASPPLLNSVSAFDGNGNTGGLYAYGTGTDADRAIGILNSAALGAGAYGAIFKNNTGVTITDLKIEYRGEQWRDGGNASTQSLEFYYGSSATPITTFDTTFGGFTFVPELTFATPIASITATALDGNNVANYLDFSHTISGLSIAAGDEIVIKWVDLDNAGNDHGMAVDNFALTANPGVGPVFANGDANGDTFIDVADVTAIYNFVAAITGPVTGDGDVDNDADVDAADATALINYLVNGTPIP